MKRAYCDSGTHDRCAVALCECACHGAEYRECVESALDQAYLGREAARDRFRETEYGSAEWQEAMQAFVAYDQRAEYLKALLREEFPALR